MKRLNLVIPKGSIFDSIMKLFLDAGIYMKMNERVYRPFVSDPELQVKVLRPQNIPDLIEIGSHDAGFTGRDWIVESDADVVEVMDLKLDPVRIVSAIPENTDIKILRRKKIIVASEYERLTKEFLNKEGFNYKFLRTYGATEVFPPEDADMIIDNTATGTTLKEHNLKIYKVIMDSTTRFIASRDALRNPWKKDKIEELKMLFQAVLDARERVMLEMNVPKEKFEQIVKILPCMRAPTVAPLYGEKGFAVKVAVKKNEVVKLIPRLKKLGATDILEYEFRKVVI
ncbi:MAG: ATP phosphoribosyltransferase [candidate division WOR-3 bacterium]|nr:ATP phosphoribosyltransferase [candidate division WOR-3 bacterium]